MNNIKVSVVLPCYNVEKYIREGLNSIMTQTLSEWEAIMVDDGATDSTGQICDEYTEKDSRFRVIHTKNQGVSCARNTGMKQATGELLYFMDPDDWIEPNCFDRCYETYQKYDCDMIHIGCRWHEKTHSYELKRDFAVYEGKEIIDNYTGARAGFSQTALNHYYNGEFIWKYISLFAAWNFVCRRSFIIENSFEFLPRVQPNEDAIFVMEATAKANRIVSIPDILYQYYLRSDGSTLRKRTPQKIFEDHYTLMIHRYRIRKAIKNVNLQDYYIGSNIFSCLRLAIAMSIIFKYYKDFNTFVNHPDVQESIKKVSLKNAPIRFAIPVRLLKLHCQWILYFGCWMAHKLGIRLPDTL